VGDWRHFTHYAEGWPAYPPGQVMTDALTQAVAAPATLGTLLAQAQQQMNDAVAAALTGTPATSS